MWICMDCWRTWDVWDSVTSMDWSFNEPWIAVLLRCAKKMLNVPMMLMMKSLKDEFWRKVLSTRMGSGSAGVLLLDCIVCSVSQFLDSTHSSLAKGQIS